MRQFKSGWHPSRPSPNHKWLSLRILDKDETPADINLITSGYMPPVYDQADLGDCGPNAYIGDAQYLVNKSNYPHKYMGSRLFLYYNTREIMGTVNSDSGVDNTSMTDALNKYGICPEMEGDGTNPDWLWTYDNYQTKYLQKPNDACYKDAILHDKWEAENVPLDGDAIDTSLAAGFPILIGITVFKSIMSSETMSSGDIPDPGGLFDSEEGGHDILVVGRFYDPSGKRRYRIRNSWSTAFGAQSQYPGYGTISEEYITNPNLGGDYKRLTLAS